MELFDVCAMLIPREQLSESGLGNPLKMLHQCNIWCTTVIWMNPVFISVYNLFIFKHFYEKNNLVESVTFYFSESRIGADYTDFSDFGCLAAFAYFVFKAFLYHSENDCG